MNEAQKAAGLVKWLVDYKKVKLTSAYYIAMHKYHLHKIDKIRAEYQLIKSVHSSQIKLI